MKQRKVIIWAKNIDDFIFGESFFGGGITVQMYYWAKTFGANGWKVFSFSAKKKLIIENINFLKSPNWKYASILFDLLLSLYFILKIKPDVIFIRGANPKMGYLSLYARITRTKLVFLGASDRNFYKGEENISGLKHNTLLYQWGLKNIKYIIVQNQLQQQKLHENYKKTSLIVSNIWYLEKVNILSPLSNTTILWVSNFRKLKRPQWFINLAKNKMHNELFIMVGAPIDQNLYQATKQEAEKVNNMQFTGGLPFKIVNEYFSQCKLFVCTSEYEGFPNTFLQAWSNNVPVVSTVDPSNVIKKHKLGIIVSSEEELLAATKKLLSDNRLYLEIQNNIKQYFESNHDSQTQFEKVLTYINCK